MNSEKKNRSLNVEFTQNLVKYFSVGNILEPILLEQAIIMNVL